MLMRRMVGERVDRDVPEEDIEDYRCAGWLPVDEIPKDERPKLFGAAAEKPAKGRR